MLKLLQKNIFYVKTSGKRHLTQYSVAHASKVIGRYVPVAAILNFLK